MVTKRKLVANTFTLSLILAKIHMVTKLNPIDLYIYMCLILAKIHMVTKLIHVSNTS